MPEIIPIAGVVLRDEQGKYLLVQERKSAVQGLWNWPAGHVDPGETSQKAAVREAYEETGLIIELTEAEPFYGSRGDRGTMHFLQLFKGRVLGGTLRHQSEELLDAKWLNTTQIKQLDKAGQTRGGWILAAVTELEKCHENFGD